VQARPVHVLCTRCESSHLATTLSCTSLAPAGPMTVPNLTMRPARCVVIFSCPAGHVVTIRASGTPSFARHCPRCPLRRRCTNARAGRVIRVHPDHDRLRAARPQAADAGFWAAYTIIRPMGERSISWLVADGCGKVRYRRLEQPALAPRALRGAQRGRCQGTLRSGPSMSAMASCHS
jgi:hypothetical protein